jgi:hypothetical protein
VQIGIVGRCNAGSFGEKAERKRRLQCKSQKLSGKRIHKSWIRKENVLENAANVGDKDSVRKIDRKLKKACTDPGQGIRVKDVFEHKQFNIAKESRLIKLRVAEIGGEEMHHRRATRDFSNGAFDRNLLGKEREYLVKKRISSIQS